MSNFSLKLDNVHVSYPPGRLRLLARSTALFVSEMQSLPEQYSCLLDLILSDSVWARRGVRCRIDFRIHFSNTSLTQYGRDKFVDELGQHVRDLPLWYQLTLLPSLKIPSTPDSSGSGEDFSLELAPSLPIHPGAHSDLVTDLFSQDVQPPPSVEQVMLQRIDVRLEYHALSQNGRSRRRSDMMLLDISDVYNGTRDDRQAPKETESESNKDENILFDECLFLEEDGSSENEDVLLHDECHKEPPRVSSMRSGHGVDVHHSHLMFDARRRPTATPDLYELLEIIPAKKLLDVAIRTLIGGSQKARLGIRYLNIPSATGPLLSDLIPSMWAPRYFKTISQRSQFIPSISQSINNLLLRNAQSPNLRHKIAQLAQSCETKSNIYQQSREQPTRTSLGEIQSRIWKNMQSSVRQPENAQNLRPGSYITGRDDDQGQINTVSDPRGVVVSKIGSVEDQNYDLLFQEDVRNDDDQDFLDLVLAARNYDDEDDSDIFEKLSTGDDAYDSFLDLFEENAGNSDKEYGSLQYCKVDRDDTKRLKDTELWGKDSGNADMQRRMDDMEMLDFSHGALIPLGLQDSQWGEV